MAESLPTNDKAELEYGILSDDYMAVMDKLFKAFQKGIDEHASYSWLVKALACESPILSETDYGLFYNSSLIKSDY